MEDVMSTLITRRALVASTAAIPAIALPAVAAPAPDNELRRLWSEYLDRLPEFKITGERHSAVRAAYDAQEPPCPDEMLSGREAAYDAWNAAAERVMEIGDAMQQIQAESLFGIGAQLTALAVRYDGFDLTLAVHTTLVRIDRLIGSDFGTALKLGGIEVVDDEEAA
jgi:hypothetical protein